MSKDWTGNHASIWKILGATNHADGERQIDDFYATDPIAIDKLLAATGLPHNLWEPSCGQGHLSKRLIEHGYNVQSSDLVDRGYGQPGIDFLQTSALPFDMTENIGIITNPPYKYHIDFIEHALEILPEGSPAIFLLKTTALEGNQRFEKLYSKGYLKTYFQFVRRLACAKNAEFGDMTKGGGSAVAYAWYWFEKGNKQTPTIQWI